MLNEPPYAQTSPSIRLWEQTGMPALKSGRISEEGLLGHTLRVFLRYNALKTQFLYEQLTPKKKLVFDLVPLLLHLDGRKLLDDDEVCELSPHGIYSYEVAPRVKAAFQAAFPDRRLPWTRHRASFDPAMPIKSVSLIGSLGSIAQNGKSDFDYWICVDAKSARWTGMFPFLEKMRLIEKWAQRFAGAEVHCFPIDLQRLLDRDFGYVSGEHSGSAQGKLLVEELYRSMTLIAGQAPMWWAMPPYVDDDEYRRLAEVIRRSHRIDETRLIDMGNIHDVDLGEFYGAAIWHINKTICSPFKSVLKLALLEEYLFNRGSNGLLCDQLKSRLLSREEDLNFMDPYVLMFERAAAYLREQGRLEHLRLLRYALYLKSGVQFNLSDRRRPDPPRKTAVVRRLVDRWGWDQATLDHLNNHRFWSFNDTKTFSRRINHFILETHRRIIAEKHKAGRDFHPVIRKRDLTILGRKLFIFYSHRTNKVESISNVADRPPVLFGLTLQYDDDPRPCWSAYRGFLSREAICGGDLEGHLLKRVPSLTRLLIWLVNNQLYDHWTSIHLNVNAQFARPRCTVPDLHGLLRQLMVFFPINQPSRLNEADLLDKPHTRRMFLVVNLENPDNDQCLDQADLISQNSWGELFFKQYDRPADSLAVAGAFIKKRGRAAFDSEAKRFKFFVPPRQYNQQFIQNLQEVLGLNDPHD